MPNANLHGAGLSNANLHGADLTGADLTGANLFNVDLSEAILINIVYDTNLRLDKANFENAIIDNPDFIDYLSKVSPSTLPAKLIPEKLKNKEELRKKLLQFGLRESYVDALVNLSKLPEI